MTESTWRDCLNENLLLEILGESKTIINVSIQPAVSKGENFLSTILRAEVEYKNNHLEEITHKTSLILKNLPMVPRVKKFVQDCGLLTKESEMYNHVIPEMSAVLGKSIAPRCLGCSKSNTLILEDLRTHNFINGNRVTGLDFEHCKSAVKILAEFHGASYLINKTQPDLLEPVKNEVQFTDENPFQKNFVINTFKIIADELKNWPDCEKYSDKLHSVSERMWCETVKEILPNENDISVLNHGDFWTNNILFRHDNQNNIVETKLIDFQFSRWTSPALDLQIFFTISVHNKEFIPFLIDIYVSHLNTLIHPQLMTKVELINALHRTECFSLVIAVSVLPLLLLDPLKAISFKADKDSLDDSFGNNPMSLIACKDETYKKLFSEYLKHYEKIGLL